MFGTVIKSPQNQQTPFKPSNPCAAAKVYAHHIADIYRQSYGMFISCGILFNHESPYRERYFLTRKSAYGAACAKLGMTDSEALNEEGELIMCAGKLMLGNLDAARDWGWAKDYVDAMWRMLQRPRADNYVIGTGRLRTVRELYRVAFGCVGRDWRDYVVTDRRFVRATETGATVADASKAKREWDWI